MPETSNLRKRRGVTRASTTKLFTRLKTLESKVHEPTTLDLAQQLTPNLKSLDAQFEDQHFLIIDTIDESDVDSLGREQEVLDNHDEEISVMSLRIQQLNRRCSSVSDSGMRKTISRSLIDLQGRLASVETSSATLSDAPEQIHVLHQYSEQLTDLKTELGTIRQSVLAMGVESTDELFATVTGLAERLFDASVNIKGLLYHRSEVPVSKESSHTAPTSHGVRLPKLDVPTFNGDILNCRTFWEQFCIAIHDRTHLSDAEKLAYLRHALKDSTAKSTIEGLSRSGDHYAETVKCLETRYNRPKLIYQAHVKKIVEIPALKDGSGSELHRLHDIAQQHIRALKAMGHEPDGTFITSFLQLKLDKTTIYEWQKHNQDSTDVSHYQDLLDFINMRAQASETLNSETCRPQRSDHPRKPPPFRSATFTAEVNGNCVVCRTEKHALFTCPQFKSLPRDKMISTVRYNELCLNCLKPGHFSKRCRSQNRCRRCQRPHHTLIHNDSRESLITTAPPQMPSLTSSTDPIVSSNTSAGSNIPNTLLMTCQVRIKAPDGTYVKARALLDSGSTISFV